MTFVLKVGVGKAGFEIQTETGEPVDELNRFLLSLWARALSPLTIRTYGYGLVVFYRWLQSTGRTLAGLTGDDLVEWVIAQRDREVSAHTINHRLHTGHQIYRFIMDQEMPSPPSARLTTRTYPGHVFDHRLGLIKFRRQTGAKTFRVKPVHRLIEPLNAAQVNTFLGATARYRDLAMVLLMLLCGLRSREVLLLRISDLDLTEAKIRVHGKGNKERALPLPESLAIVIRKYLYLERPPESSSDRVFVVLRGHGRGQPMTAAGLRSLFRVRRRSKSALRIANPHRFRHTFGADMARSGVCLPVLQRMMGHSSGLTTLRYIRLSVDDIAEEYDRAMGRIGKRYAASLPR